MRETTQPFPRIAMREARLVSNMRFQSSKGRGRRGKSIYSAHCVNRLARSPRGRIFVGQHRENTEAYERHGNRLSSRPAAWRPPESEAAAVANPPRQNFHLGILILSASTPERTCAVQLRDVRFVPISGHLRRRTTETERPPRAARRGTHGENDEDCGTGLRLEPRPILFAFIIAVLLLQASLPAS